MHSPDTTIEVGSNEPVILRISRTWTDHCIRVTNAGYGKVTLCVGLLEIHMATEVTVDIQPDEVDEFAWRVKRVTP